MDAASAKAEGDKSAPERKSQVTCEGQKRFGSDRRVFPFFAWLVIHPRVCMSGTAGTILDEELKTSFP